MNEPEKKAQQLYSEFQMIDANVKQLQRQLELATQQIMEISSTSQSLDEFEKIQSGKEILVPLSSGIFAKASIKDNSELLVNVGSNVVVSKDVASTKALLQKQLEEVRSVHSQMNNELEKMIHRATKIQVELSGLVGENNF
ncbi:MAG TPA: prefoldin subunit alpha [Candidatus Nanoarchaeia archaeon]|nr:prefoldin subunit alpha [Candidatus Nanoarchaeia archaeon]